MWTTKILDAARGTGGLLDVSVEYTNSETGEKADEKFHGVQDQANLDHLIQEKLDYLNKAKQAEIATGDWAAPVAPPPPPLPPPTQQEIDKKVFQDSYQLVQRYNRAIASGILDKMDAGYLAALKDAQGKFVSDYINLI